MPLDFSTCLKFYKRQDIQEAIVEHAARKEIGVRYNEAFGKRPDILIYPKEVLEFALRNATSFHASEELWDNPLNLNSNLTKKEMDELRVGWDLVLDIDCKFLDYSKICADLVIKFLKYCEVKDISLKFSGNKGFHIGVPWEAFPKQVGNTPTKILFPEAAKKIAFYIKENIKEELGRRILEFEKNDFGLIREKVNLSQEEISRYIINEEGDKIAKLEVERFLEIDTILISPRHLYRLPYSLHEKSGLVSLPIDSERVMQFSREMAEPEKILSPMFKFLDRNVANESARRLLINALDFEIIVQEKIKEQKERQDGQKKADFEEMKIECPIKEEFFPPCLKQLLNGIEDGKKRGVFCLSNFLGKIGWSRKEIEEYLLKWNKEKNKIPLRDNYIVSQLRYFQLGERLPPNCDNENYYLGLALCQKDSLCLRIKNPVNYTLLRWKRHLQDTEELKKEEEKEQKRKAREERKLEKRKIFL